jgi:UPF0755 protein
LKAALLALPAVVVLAAAGVVQVARERLAPVRDDAPEVLFDVPRGSSLGVVSRGLEADGLVRDARAVEWLARYRGVAGRLRAGEYRLSAAMAPAEILDHLTEGRVATYAVVLPEGFTAAQIAERLEARDLAEAGAFNAAVRDVGLARELGIPAPTLEGYLYPETYRLPRGLGAREIARIMVAQFRQAWSEIEPRALERGFDMHEVVTLASIVEKETGAPEERPLIASVFANRLERGMRLESDPTVIYGIPRFDGNLRRRDLENESNVYNTYRHRGLPPGPIASPGLAALLAVVEPAESEYLYFVSRNDGTHLFSTNYRDHVNAVNRYQRRGRSK